MNQADLAFAPALQQAQLIRNGEVSPLQLVELYLERINKFNSQLGSYFTVAGELALEDGKAKTEQLTQVDVTQLPPFFGVPTAIKDLNAVKGMPCSYGVAALKEKISPYDDGVTTRMKMAGFIILGKTATSAIGSLPYTEPLGFSPARNPWNLEYTPGGSSGGAAAAVAAGLCGIAQGSDGGGSIRGPSSSCSLVGLKPSRGRVSHAPVGDYQSGISTSGPLARNVEDAAALLDIMSGYVVGDPYWLPLPETSFFHAAQQSPGQLKIAFSTSIAPFGEATAEIKQAVEKTAKLCESSGHTLESACPDFSGLIKPFTKIWQAGVTATGIPLEALSPLDRWIGEQAGSAGEYLQAVAQMQLIARQIVAFFENYDVLILPVYLHSALKIGEWANLEPEETLQKIIAWIAPCPGVNASGLPAIALPTGFDRHGLPIGIQIIGRPAAETTLISLAGQLEAAKLWENQRPALFKD
ncbi:MAG: amidase [Spirulinaceae cyanobacterium]